MAQTNHSGGLRARRRALVKSYGRKIFRRMDEWLAAQSLVSNDPVLDKSEFPALQLLEDNWMKVRGELDALLERRDALPCFQDISPDQYRISPDDRWKTFVFYGFGERSEQAAELCPETMQLLDRIPELETAFFSILAPGKHVPLHKGVTKAMIRGHLGLKVPGQSERCTMTVGGEVCTWAEGKLLVFDDSYPHEVTNDTPEERAVLLFDFKRPMSRQGQVASSVLMKLLRKSAYFKDAQKNLADWEERYRRQHMGA